MRVLGIVEWVGPGRLGEKFAKVFSLVRIDGSEWIPVEPEDFPPEGRAFWPPPARDAVPDALVFFTAASNAPGFKEEFVVTDPKPCVEVLDLRHLGEIDKVRQAVVGKGVRFDWEVESRVLLLCDGDLAVGPVKLKRASPTAFVLDIPNKDHIPTFRCDDLHIRQVTVHGTVRLVLPSPTLPAHYGFVDWDDDLQVAKRAVKFAASHASEEGASVTLTKRLIEEAVTALAGQANTPELRLEFSRLQRAHELAKNYDKTMAMAAHLCQDLIEHPALAAELHDLKKEAKTKYLEQIKAESQHQEEALETKRQELEAIEQQITEATSRLKNAQDTADAFVGEVDSLIATRVSQLLGKPASALAEAAVLRALTGSVAQQSGQSRADVPPQAAPFPWSKATEIRDLGAFKKALVASFRERGVAAECGLRLHAALTARLLPVLVGPNAATAAAAYCRVACASRVFTVHVAPGFTHPSDLFACEPKTWAGPFSLLSFLGAASEHSDPGLVLLEGINRAPTESYLLPFLQLLADAEPRVSAGTPWPSNVRLVAIAVEGPTTLPLAPSLWSNAVLLESDSCPRSSSDASSLSEVALDSLLPATPPAVSKIIDTLLEQNLLAADFRDCLTRYGSALSQLRFTDSDTERALSTGVLLPIAASLTDEEERTAAFDAVRGTWGDDDGLDSTFRRIRRRIA